MVHLEPSSLVSRSTEGLWRYHERIQGSLGDISNEGEISPHPRIG